MKRHDPFASQAPAADAPAPTPPAKPGRSRKVQTPVAPAPPALPAAFVFETVPVVPILTVLPDPTPAETAERAVIDAGLAVVARAPELDTFPAWRARLRARAARLAN